VNRRIWVHTGRILLAVAFWVAAVHKVLDPAAFAGAIHQYGILPPTWVNAAALTLPWIEITAAGALLMWPRGRPGAALVLLGLLGVFVVAMIINLWQGAEIPCGCFSSSLEADPLTWRSVARNLGYMVLAWWVLLDSGPFAWQQARAKV